MEQGENSGEGGYSAPFERYVLTRGQADPSSFQSKDKDRSVGFFKGLVRLVEFDPTAKPLGFEKDGARKEAAAAEAAGKKAQAAAAQKALELEADDEEEEEEGGGVKVVDGEGSGGSGDEPLAFGDFEAAVAAAAAANEEGGVADGSSDVKTAAAANDVAVGVGVGVGALSAAAVAVQAGESGGGGGGDEVEAQPVIEQERDLYDFEVLLGAPKTYKVRHPWSHSSVLPYFTLTTRPHQHSQQRSLQDPQQHSQQPHLQPRLLKRCACM